MQLGGRRIPSDRQERRERVRQHGGQNEHRGHELLDIADELLDPDLTKDQRARLMRAYSDVLQRPAPEPSAGGRLHASGRCAYCFAPLTNGEPVCSEACDEAHWRLIPTTNGELWVPEKKDPA